MKKVLIGLAGFASFVFLLKRLSDKRLLFLQGVSMESDVAVNLSDKTQVEGIIEGSLIKGNPVTFLHIDNENCYLCKSKSQERFDTVRGIDVQYDSVKLAGKTLHVVRAKSV